MMSLTMKQKFILKSVLALLVMNTSLTLAQAPADVDAKIAQIEAESMKELDKQSGVSFKDVLSQAENTVEKANSVNECQSISLSVPKCRDDTGCQNDLWEKIKRCVSRFPLASVNGTFTEWLKDRYRLLRQDIDRNDRTIAQYEHEIARADAILAKAQAETAEVMASIEQIKLDEAQMANAESMDEIQRIREELAAKEASLTQNTKSKNESSEETNGQPDAPSDAPGEVKPA